ncbi:MAG: DUF1318 domain-containing protein [Sumerlaeia bacterium]
MTKTTKWLQRMTVLASLAVLTMGCGRGLFNINIVSEQTTLEKQVLGTYSSLGQDLTIYSSVRGVAPDGTLKVPPERTQSQQRVFEAIRNREYNRDDVERLLADGVVGEGNDGLLMMREEASAETFIALTAEEVLAIVEEENEDRRAILNRLVTTTPGVERDQAEDVAWIFASLNQDAAPAGAWVQERRGDWRRK